MAEVTALVNPLDWLRDLLNRLRDLLGEIVGLIRDRLAKSIDNVTSAIQGALSALGERLSALVTSLKDFLRPLMEGIRSQLEGLVRGLSSLATSIVSGLRSALEDMAESIADVVGWFTARLREAFASVVAAVQSAVGAIVDNLRMLLGGLRDVIGGVVSAIREGLHSLWSSMWGGIQEIWGRIRDFLETQYQRVLAFAGDVLERIRTSLVQLGERIERTVTEVFEAIRKWVTGKVNALVSWARNTWDQVESWARQTLARVFATLADWVGRATIAAEYIVEIAKLIWSYIARGDFATAAWAVDEFFQGIGLPQPIKVVHSIVSAIAWFWFTVQVQFVPAQMAAQMRASTALRPSGISPELAALGVHLGYLSEADFYDNASRVGIPDNLARAAFAALRRWPTPDEIAHAYIRGEIDEGLHDSLLRLMGFDDTGIRIKKLLYWTIPTPSDLIRMAVRECFSPEIAAKFGQYEDIPEEFIKWAQKVGLSEFWAKAYWAAHWDLPSAEMGFRMLHRGIIDEEELKMLLRALDVMPFWRERLIKLSYNPYTRVDVRRMYQLGVLSDEEVVRAYKDLGYDEEKAQKLAEFTKRYYSPEDYTELDRYREMTQTFIVKAYKRGVISREEAKERLMEIRYSEQDSELLLRLADAEIALEGATEERIPLINQTVGIILEAYKRRLYTQEEVARLLSELGKTDKEIRWYIALSDYEVEKEVDLNLFEIARRKYVERTWSRDEVAGFLTSLNLPGHTISELLDRWDLERMATFRKPSEAQFRAALQRGIITLEEYKEELRGLGYDEKYVEMLARLAVGGK